MSDAVDALLRHGGIASRGDLLRSTTRHHLRAAVVAGRVVEVRRGVYRLPDVDHDRAVAARLRGVVSHLSAAKSHGWEVAPDGRSWVTIDRRRHALGPTDGAEVFYADLTDEPGPVTSPVRTVIDCGRRLPFPRALVVADAALRDGVDAAELRAAAAGVRGKGAGAVRRVVAAASPLAANHFESVLRGLAIEAGLDVVPQGAVPVPVVLRSAGDAEVLHPDVVDRGRRIALEADSWEFHSEKEAFQRDCWRYSVLVAQGWRVLRFTWWQVMHHPEWVLRAIRSARSTGMAA